MGCPCSYDTPCLKTNEYVDNTWVVSAGEHSWSTCASGFGIAGIVKSSSCKSADCIESSLCRHGLDMATCYNANWDEDTPCSNGYYLHGIGRNFTVATDMSALTGGVCCKLQDFSDAYGSCTDVSFTSTLKEWPVCPDNFLLTGIRRANLGNTIDDIIGFQCCSPPSNALPTVIPECQGKINNFGLAASSTSTRATCSIGTVDCSASSSSNVGETRKWRLVYRQTIESFCKDDEVYTLTSDRENTQMIIHGKTLGVEKGINIAVLNAETQELEERETFDIYSSYDENTNLLNFL